MDLPSPPRAVAALAAFVRDRLAEVTGTISPLLSRRDGADVQLVEANEHAVVTAARQFALVIVGAAAPFAQTSYSRARLLRQMHASGLLTADEARRTSTLLALEDGTRGGAPR
jgi:hypothetical protein